MREKSPNILFFLCLSGVLFLSNCEGASAPMQIVPNPLISITVLHQDGQPADSVQIRVFDKNKGTEIDLCAAGSYCVEGKTGCCGDYFIFHNEVTDKAKDRLTFQTRKVTLEVEGTLDSLFFREEFVVSTFGGDVFKIAGPDTVYIEPKVD